MSSRRTAFARVPRGTGKNSSPSGGTIRIDKRFLDQFTHARMSAELSTVLTNTGGEVQVNLGPNGSGTYKVVDRSGSVLADEADFAKIQTLGSFINEERKAILKGSVSTKTQKFLAGMVSLEKVLAEGKTLKFTKAFVDIFRTVQAQVDTLSQNAEVFNEVSEEDPVNYPVAQYVQDQTTRIRVAAVNFLVHRATLGPDEEAKKLNDFLFEKGVIMWVYNRLTAAKISPLSREQEARHVFFPRDPTKGMTISWREWKTAAVRENQGSMLTGMKNFQYFFSNEVVRKFTNSPESWDLDQFGPKDPARVLAGVPILVPIPVFLIKKEEVFGALARSGDKGMSWSVGNATDPSAVLKFMGTVPKRIQCGFFQSALTKVPLLETMFKGFKYDPANEEKRGVYAQIAHWGKSVDGRSWFERSINDMAYKTLSQVLILTMGVTPADDFGRLLIANCSGDKSPDIKKGVALSEPDRWVQIASTAMGLSAEAVKQSLTGKLEADLTSAKKRKENKTFLTARSQLSPAGVQLSASLRQRRYIELSSRVEEWLRTFLTTSIQTAVASLLAARLEAHLSAPVAVDKSDLAGVVDVHQFNWADDESVQEPEPLEEAEEKDDDEIANPDDE